MKCQNCGTDFEGNICPNCNTTINQEHEPIQGIQTDSAQMNHNHSYGYQSTEPAKHKGKKSKRLIFEIIGGFLLIIFMFSSVGKVPKSDYDKLQSDYNSLSSSNKKAETELKEYKKMETEYSAYKERMQPYEVLDEAEAEARRIEAEKIAADKKAAEEKAVTDQKAAEEKAAADAAAAKAAEEARGYETGITYDQLARTPDNFAGQKVKFYGKVIQVMESSGTIQIRFAVDDNYDTILLGEYSSSTVSSRVLEDDYVTIYGSSVGTITYQSTMGGNITVPGVYIEKIDQ